MHIITGGAYNGKAAWVRDFYELVDQNDYHWFNGYENDSLPSDLSNIDGYIIFEGVEQWVFKWIKEKELDEAREYGRDLIEKWLTWEQQYSDRKLIVIGTDMSKGIVPMDAEMRKWRDLTGWFYQDLVKKSERVDVIWYGIANQLK